MRSAGCTIRCCHRRCGFLLPLYALRGREEVLASKKLDSAFISKSFTYWKEGPKAFKKHQGSDCHREATVTSKTLWLFSLGARRSCRVQSIERLKASSTNSSRLSKPCSFTPKLHLETLSGGPKCKIFLGKCMPPDPPSERALCAILRSTTSHLTN